MQWFLYLTEPTCAQSYLLESQSCYFSDSTMLFNQTDLL